MFKKKFLIFKVHAYFHKAYSIYGTDTVPKGWLMQNKNIENVYFLQTWEPRGETRMGACDIQQRNLTIKVSNSELSHGIKALDTSGPRSPGLTQILPSMVAAAAANMYTVPATARRCHECLEYSALSSPHKSHEVGTITPLFPLSRTRRQSSTDCPDHTACKEQSQDTHHGGLDPDYSNHYCKLPLIHRDLKFPSLWGFKWHLLTENTVFYTNYITENASLDWTNKQEQLTFTWKI